MNYIDPGAGALLLQMLGGVLIGLVAFVGRVRRAVFRLFTRGQDTG